MNNLWCAFQFPGGDKFLVTRSLSNKLHTVDQVKRPTVSPSNMSLGNLSKPFPIWWTIHRKSQIMNTLWTKYYFWIKNLIYYEVVFFITCLRILLEYQVKQNKFGLAHGFEGWKSEWCNTGPCKSLPSCPTSWKAALWEQEFSKLVRSPWKQSQSEG